MVCLMDQKDHQNITKYIKKICTGKLHDMVAVSSHKASHESESLNEYIQVIIIDLTVHTLVM